ncbi:family 31 glucosidase [Globicatella sp. HMSC072A10]|uniref:glycoside hydrolase family 31 protein n=1 Tax=Globicatella sp. HMSC072A10 TaxID=1739315 RepID=UPI0008CB4557|nr:TIM-barrel domain-containing protein [Globicatella sp. HMSC072A10]OFK57030.1 family 31 glucosidase [Globicatella sp. HMSC072A10]
MIKVFDTYIEKRYDTELLRIDAWGKDSFRVRSFADRKFTDENYALNKVSDSTSILQVVDQKENEITVKNGKLTVVIDHRDRITFYDENNKVLLQEFIRLRAVKHDDGAEDVGTIEITKDFNSTLKLKSREFKTNLGGGSFETTTRFESNPKEKIFGMGQYQHEFLNLKNTKLELAQRNSQMSIPFYISSLGYGFLWNNPGIGEVTFAKNITEWHMESTNVIDYWITTGDTLKDISKNYADVTGKVPLMPKKLLGLWQSKLRYRTPDEVLDVVKRYHEKGIQLSTIAIDYFHWPKQGEYRFDEDFWPEPEKLIKELKEDYNVDPIISIWPTVQSDADNYNDYLEGGYLINVNRGVRLTMLIQGTTVFLDTTNPEARDYVWDRIKKNYKDLGINYYWVDVAEPGYAVYDFDNYRYHSGQALETANLYPNGFLKMVYDGMKNENHEVVTLVRGAWAGAQKYGALGWSGDIDSSFEAFNNQVNTGLNVGMAGMPWWTTDIGGFHGGNPEDEEFRELMVRWFQYSTFSPILRMHGDRLPHSKPLSNSGGGSMPTGAPNEIWSFGKEAEKIMTKYLHIREALRDYIYDLMIEAHEDGIPLMRPLFYEFPEDDQTWEKDNIYMFGEDMLVAPIMNYKDRQREVYLPDGEKWVNIFTKNEYEGGQSYIIDAPIESIPVFIKKSSTDYFNDLLKIASDS